MKHALILLMLSFSLLQAQNILTFSVHNSAGIYSITCKTPSLNLTASSNYSAPVNYVWQLPAQTTGSAVTLLSGGIYTVTAASGTLSSTQIFTIGTNTTLPVKNPNNGFAVTSSSAGVTVTFTAISPTVNFDQHLYYPSGIMVNQISFTAHFNVFIPGAYTHCLVNYENGCKTCSTFTVMQPAGLDALSQQAEQAIAIFPNPSRYSARLDIGKHITGELKLVLSSLSGELISERTIDASKPEDLNISTKDLPSGIYLLKILNGSRQYDTKLVVNN